MSWAILKSSKPQNIKGLIPHMDVFSKFAMVKLCLIYIFLGASVLKPTSFALVLEKVGENGQKSKWVNYEINVKHVLSMSHSEQTLSLV